MKDKTVSNAESFVPNNKSAQGERFPPFFQRDFTSSMCIIWVPFLYCYLCPGGRGKQWWRLFLQLPDLSPRVIIGAMTTSYYALRGISDCSSGARAITDHFPLLLVFGGGIILNKNTRRRRMLVIIRRERSLKSLFFVPQIGDKNSLFQEIKAVCGGKTNFSKGRKWRDLD